MDILDGVKTVLKQPFWVVVFVVGAVLTALPCVDFNGAKGFTTHDPHSWPLFCMGAALIPLSLLFFLINFVAEHNVKAQAELTALDAGLDTSRVEKIDSAFSPRIGECEIRVEFGRIEEFAPESESIFLLPCNEYFDRACITDPKGALGAYVGRVFVGRTSDFADLVQSQIGEKLGAPTSCQKTDTEKGFSYGAGRALLLQNVLKTEQTIALVSTTTQRAGEGLIARISYLFAGLTGLVNSLAETTRIREIAMPLLGAGHGGIAPPLALVGLLVALAEAIRDGVGARRLKKVTIIVFRKDANSKPEVHPTVVCRALALISQQV